MSIKVVGINTRHSLTLALKIIKTNNPALSTGLFVNRWLLLIGCGWERLSFFFSGSKFRSGAEAQMKRVVGEDRDAA